MPKILIVSDIHANLTALEAVLADFQQATGGQPAVIWSLGDMVDYGAEPEAVLDCLQQYPLIAILGNHELALLGKVELALFNPDARKSALWTRGQVGERNLAFLAGLSSSIQVAVGDSEFTLAHGSPRDPVWEYLLQADDAAGNFVMMETDHALVGHTHIASYFRLAPGKGDRSVVGSYAARDRETLRLPTASSGERLILNPGSVGQPRDKDPRAAYLLFDDESLSFTYRRVSYDVAQTADRIKAAHLPERFARRLERGTLEQPHPGWLDWRTHSIEGVQFC